ncbi:MAG TPA: choline ABC transporter substrate-binding protein [Rhizobiaceae bacterium]
MLRTITVISFAAAVVCGASAARADDAATCKTVRLSDLGWTDIALTNATAELLLEPLGYRVEQTILGLDVTYLSLQNNDIDVFQGNWRPVQDEQFKSYFDEGSVEPLGVNLEGAKYTLAVPKYVSDAGVIGFGDLAAHAEKFDRKIYAIEPGSNQPLLDMVAAGRHGLSDWEIVESSEAGMLAQVRKSIPAERWVVFLGWEPHPMNLDFEITYLAGGDVEFGPNFGGATVRTLSRKGYSAECPNVARFFTNLVFDLDYENYGMRMITADSLSPADAAREMIRKDASKLEKWLAGVETLDGGPATPAVRSALGL